MAVYVDPLIDYGWELGPSCHMTADSERELNMFALSIGLKLEWIQKSVGGLTHYDLTKNKRILAVKKGAVELTMKEASIRYSKKLDNGI